jgi:YVTN family beta-propeller protein
MDKLHYIVLLFFGLLISNITPASDRTSTIKLSPDGNTLAVVNNDSRSISFIDSVSGSRSAEILVGKDPQTISFDSSGQWAYVTNRFDDSLSVIDVIQSALLTTVPVADEPIGVVASSVGMIFVSCQGADSILVFDASDFSLVEVIKTESSPRGMALSPDESLLYVTHFFSGRLSTINTSTLTVEAITSTGGDSNLSHGLILDSSGQFAFIPHTRSDVTNPALLFDTTVFPVVSVMDLTTLTHVPDHRIHLDISDMPVNLPWDVVLVSDETLYVLNSGSNDISVIELESSKALAHLEIGDNPRGMALSKDQGRLYVNNNLGGTVTVINTHTQTIEDEFHSTDIALTDAILNGKRLFHSSNRTDLARDQWISCATCHFDGEMDRRTWFFPDGPRNTTSLLGLRDTLPMHWSGDLDELQDVEITIRTIQAGTGLAEGPDNCDPACDQAPPNALRSDELDDLAEFMASLEMAPNPNLNEAGGLTAIARRGKALFESDETQCAVCHIPPLYTDQARHAVGTEAKTGERKGSSFDTPSLRGIYKTQPYLHDGSASTAMELLTTHNPDDLHGQTSQLTDPELRDLVAFLYSIGSEPAKLQITEILNGTWNDPERPNRTITIRVDPEPSRLSLAWREPLPSGPADPPLGNRFRWLNAQGTYIENRAELMVWSRITPPQLGSGIGPFNFISGSMTLEFSGCSAGIVTFDLPGLGQPGLFAIQRSESDHVANC